MSQKTSLRSGYCGALRETDVGREVTVCGWVSRQRDLGGLIFIDLRDREGIVQCVFNESDDKDLFDAAFPVRAEWVISVTGKVRRRESPNPEMPTGLIEIFASRMEVFTKADTPPFEVHEQVNASELLRLKYRYLELRRPSFQRSIAMRHRAAIETRKYCDENGFLEIETPMLTRSSPEGARDYLVPSRVSPGSFYALPQSPQQYKQILMMSGFDRYFQIVRCFRDEDLRADRQPEFTQIDIEMSFVQQEDILAVGEGLARHLFQSLLGATLPDTFPRMTYAEAMTRYGSDKPDTRFGLELGELADIVQNCSFKVFSAAAEEGSVCFINLPGCAERFSRKEIDALTEHAKLYKAKGLAWLRMTETPSSSFSKFMSEEEMAAIMERTACKDGDLLLIVADSDRETALTALGSVRLECARRLDLIPEGVFAPLWVTHFPLFEYSEEEGRWVAKHHPFTAPMDEDIGLMQSDPGRCRAKAYDMVINGYEVGGGSIRIHTPELQRRMFEMLGLSEEDVTARFGHLIEAFRYGAPPHGGMAFGFDRLCMLLCGTTNIRDIIAFPKIQNASEPMTDAPGPVDEHQLRELHIKLDLDPK